MSDKSPLPVEVPEDDGISSFFSNPAGTMTNSFSFDSMEVFFQRVLLVSLYKLFSCLFDVF